MKKRALWAIFAAVFAAALPLFSGCVRLSGNDRSKTQYFKFAETSDYCYLKMGENIYYAEYLAKNKQTGEFSVLKAETKNGVSYGDIPYIEVTESDYTENEYWRAEDGESYIIPTAPTVLDGNTSPRYSIELAPEYYGLLSVLQTNYKNDSAKLIQFYATESDADGTRVAYGFCNAYRSTVGMFAGGGCIGVEEIVYSVFFSYEPESGKFTEIERYENCNIVGYTGNRVFYYKGKKYYTRAVGGEEKYICDDIAYDSGPTYYSNANFYFNEDYAVLYLCHRPSNVEHNRDRLVVCGSDGEILLTYIDDNPI